MLKQSLTIGQKQRLSPIQYQVIKMLEYSSAEMEAVVNDELEANPALEEIEYESYEQEEDDDRMAETIEAGQEPMADDLDIMEVEEMTASDYSNTTLGRKNFDNQEFAATSLATAEESLQDNLTTQLDETTAEESIKTLGRYIIGSLDENGYLRRPIDSLIDDILFATNIEISRQQFIEALHLVQSLEPAGIAAQNLQECILIQLKRLNNIANIEIAEKIATDHFDAFTKKRYSTIKSKLKISDETLHNAIDVILRLNPKPGNLIDNAITDQRQQQITPDFTVEQYNDNLYVSLNRLNYPKLSVSKAYKEIVKELSEQKKKSIETRQALNFAKKKIDDADIFIESIEQRNQTLIKTMIAIANKQKEFFVSGNEALLVPMRLKDVAEIVGYDQSTISRVTNSKYVQTSFGIFPLRYLFSEGIQTADGQEVSNKKVMAILENIIEQEDKQNPMTDLDIATILNQKGYLLSRRTVAKYREQLNIPNSNQRILK